ncbi:MAG: hypothetical protein KC421_13050, partial [Anaerolineales bacterium]|nr:hypothetical protein [Anaerolineales bacterium]
MNYKRSLLTWLIPVAVILLTVALGSQLQRGAHVVQAGSTGDLIERVYTDKARYNPGDTVTITVDIDNQTGSTWNSTLTLNIDHLDTQVYTDTLSLNVANGITTTKTFIWTAPSADFQGYHVEIVAGTTDQNGSAIDVSSDWTQYPRYGYISEFPTGESAADSEAMIKAMAENYHINTVQLYDWMWRHEKFFKRTNGTVDSTWTDLFNRTISWSTIQNQIDSLHDNNMAAMAYAMVYAAREDYEQDSGVNPQWGIYQNMSHSNQLNVDFGDSSTYLWMFNPANTNWQNYIFTEYQDAIETADFDGIHVDQMGQRSDPYDYWSGTVDLDNTFSNFLNNSKEHLSAVAAHTTGKAGQDALTFNIVDGTVDGWAANDVSQNANVDFNYSEIWWLSDTHDDIYDYIRQVR